MGMRQEPRPLQAGEVKLRHYPFSVPASRTPRVLRTPQRSPRTRMDSRAAAEDAEREGPRSMEPTEIQTNATIAPALIATHAVEGCGFRKFRRLNSGDSDRLI
jgi:hypothetical protein